MPEDNGPNQGGTPENQNPAGGTQGAGDGGQPQNQTPASFEAFLEAQPETVRALYETHISGLRNTVQATRTERDNLAKQLRDATAKAEKGSEMEKTLSGLTQQLEGEQRRADFYEEIGKPGVNCLNPKLAWMAAQQDKLLDRNGNVDIAAVKTAYPELFQAAQQPQQQRTQGHAGAGTQQAPASGGQTMNDLIRRSAGYGN
jgi:hypothetical protein